MFSVSACKTSRGRGQLNIVMMAWDAVPLRAPLLAPNVQGFKLQDREKCRARHGVAVIIPWMFRGAEESVEIDGMRSDV